MIELGDVGVECWEDVVEALDRGQVDAAGLVSAVAAHGDRFAVLLAEALVVTRAREVALEHSGDEERDKSLRILGRLAEKARDLAGEIEDMENWVDSSCDGGPPEPRAGRADREWVRAVGEAAGEEVGTGEEARAALGRLGRAARLATELAECDCEYGDACPDGSRHGRCRPCAARSALGLGASVQGVLVGARRGGRR